MRAGRSNMGPMSSFRPPQSLSRVGVEADAALRQEIVEEQATTLARMGRKAELALAALKAHEGEGREACVKAAADAVWCFLIQREVLGLRDRAQIVRDYAVPAEVLKRIGT